MTFEEAVKMLEAPVYFEDGTPASEAVAFLKSKLEKRACGWSSLGEAVERAVEILEAEASELERPSRAG